MEMEEGIRENQREEMEMLEQTTEDNQEENLLKTFQFVRSKIIQT